MSYILDALKKSDSDRQRETEPQTRSIHAEYRVREKPRNSAWRPMVATVLLLAGGGVGVWGSRLNWFAAEPQPPPAAVKPEVPVVAVAAKPVETAPEPLHPAASSASPVQTGDVPPATALLEIWQLSEAEQRFLQTLNVSLHVYSQEPAQRTVIINGLRVREGQPLGQDLNLLEITTDGIIVSFQEQRVHLSTIEPWSQN